MSSLPPGGRPASDRNAEATVHIAHLDEKVTDGLLWELMVQAGPVQHVYIPRNRITGAHFGYGFCEFHTPLDALYATKVLNAITLFSKPIRISQSTVDRVSQDVGANLFIGNLVEDVDEKTIHDAFSAFGPLIDAPYIMNSNTNNNHHGGETNSTNTTTPPRRRYGFVKYAQFEHADAAIAAMNGQYICNHPISVQYAFKKDSHGKERHGSQAERVLAARALQAFNSQSTMERLQQNTFFSDKPASKMQHTTVPPPVTGHGQLQPPPTAAEQMIQGHHHHPQMHQVQPPPHHYRPNARPHHFPPPSHYHQQQQHYSGWRPPHHGVPHPDQMPPPQPYSQRPGQHQQRTHQPQQQQQHNIQYPPRGMDVGWSQQNRRYISRQQQQRPNAYNGREKQ